MAQAPFPPRLHFPFPFFVTCPSLRFSFALSVTPVAMALQAALRNIACPADLLPQVVRSVPYSTGKLLSREFSFLHRAHTNLGLKKFKLALTEGGPVEERGGGHVSEEGVLDSATTMMRMMKMVVAMQQRRKTGRRSSQRSRRGASLALGREGEPRGRPKVS